MKVLATALTCGLTLLSGINSASAMESQQQLCAADDPNCRMSQAVDTLSIPALYDFAAAQAGEYYRAFSYVQSVGGDIDCTLFEFRLFLAAFEELLGMSHPDQMKAALKMLETTDQCRERGEIGPDDLLVRPYSAVRAPYSKWKAMPMTMHVFRLYQSRKPTEPIDRQLLLELLERGLGAGWTTHAFQELQLQEMQPGLRPEDVKMLKTVLGQSKMDLDLAEGLLAAGIGLEPDRHTSGTGYSFTPLMATVADCNGKVDRPLLQLLYKINYNITGGVPLEQAVANQDQEIEFHGNWGFFNSLRLGNMSAFSEALDRMIHHAEETGEVVSGHKKEVTGRMDEELSLELLKALAARPDFDLSDVTLTDDKYNNFFHYAALDGFPRVVEWAGRQLASVFPVFRQGHVARDVWAALAQKNHFKRTPLHNAAALFGTHSHIYRALAELEDFAARIVHDAVSVDGGPPKPEIPTADMQQATRSADAFGRTPESYATKMVIKEKLTIAGGSSSRSYMALLDPKADVNAGTSLTYTPFTPIPSQGDEWVYPYSEADSGGWGVATKAVREELDDLKGRCDAIVHQGLPTANELQAYVAQNYPVVFKNAAKNWNFRREWTKDKFLAKYGNERVPIGNTIYPTFLYQKEEGVRMADWIESWGHPDFVPDALPSAFSTTFMGSQPKLKQEGTLEAGQLLTKHHHPFFSHFFAGASGTGAPHHWHMAAMNTVAFGRKRWFLFPPEDAEYSIKPVSRMLAEDVPRFRADPNVTMLECVQEAGDVMIVPTFWGHATLNVEPVIGVAYEMDSGFCHS